MENKNNILKKLKNLINNQNYGKINLMIVKKIKMNSQTN